MQHAPWTNYFYTYMYYWFLHLPRLFKKGRKKTQLSKIFLRDLVYNFLQVKEEFSSTAEIVHTIQTMTANLAKVMVLSLVYMCSCT